MSQEQHFLVMLQAFTRGYQAICATTILMLLGVGPRLTMGFVLALRCLTPGARPPELTPLEEHLTDRAIELSLATGLVLLAYAVSRFPL